MSLWTKENILNNLLPFFLRCASKIYDIYFNIHSFTFHSPFYKTRKKNVRKKNSHYAYLFQFALFRHHPERKRIFSVINLKWLLNILHGFCVFAFSLTQYVGCMLLKIFLFSFCSLFPRCLQSLYYYIFIFLAIFLLIT